MGGQQVESGDLRRREYYEASAGGQQVESGDLWRRTSGQWRVWVSGWRGRVERSGGGDLTLFLALLLLFLNLLCKILVLQILCRLCRLRR